MSLTLDILILNFMRLSTFCAHLQIMRVKAHTMATWGLYAMCCVNFAVLCQIVWKNGKISSYLIIVTCQLSLFHLIMHVVTIHCSEMRRHQK